MKTKEVLALLVGLCILAGTWASISYAWTINFTFVDLSRAILRSDDEAATRFENWAWGHNHSDDERDAAVYGTAMLVANNEGRELPERWLQEWESNDSHLKAGALREQMMLYALTSVLATGDQLALVDNLDAPTAARWLVSAATRRPTEAETFVRLIEDRGLASTLSPEDRLRLATVYGNLANLKRSHGSKEEVLALANRSLALDPQNEMGMIVKALALHRLGQLQAGLALSNQVTDLYPKSVFGWECLASLKLGALDYQGAERASRMAISLSSQGGPWSCVLLATALLGQGRCAEALPYAQLSVTANPDAPNYLLALADAYWCLGDREQASIIYQRLDAIAPGYGSYVRERLNVTK